ncbi:MAG: hypothetical protein ACRC7N_11705, partial [Clostridium sp.]
DIDTQTLVLIEEQDITTSTSTIDGYNCGGKVFFSSNDSVIVPFVLEAEQESGKENITYEVVTSRSIKSDIFSSINTVRSSHIDSKAKLKIKRDITNSNSVTGHLNKTVHVSDEVVKVAARKTIKNNDIKAAINRITILDLKTHFSNYRVTLKNSLVAGPTSRKLTKVNATVKKFSSNRMILRDAIKDNLILRMTTIQLGTVVRANRSTLINKAIVGPTARAVIDINVTIYRVDTSRKITANSINIKPLTRSSHLTVENQLNTKRSISTFTSLNEHIERYVGCSSFVYDDITRSIIAGEVKPFNAIRKTISNYNRVANTDRRIAIINNITGSTERTVISHQDYTKTVLTSRTIIIGNIGNYRTQRKTRASIVNDYKILRVVTLRATDSNVHYFNAIVPITIDEYPIYTFNTKLGMDFN